MNLYAYVGNNSVMFVDLMGLAAKEFVAAYDHYNTLKKEIYGVLPGSFDLDFVKLSEEQKIEQLTKLNKAKDKARTLHYSRNNYNTHNITSIEQMNGSIDWIKSSKFKSALHQIDVPENKWNTKYVDKSGKIELIFNYENGKIITDEKNVGTYNFFPAIGDDKDSLSHKKYDVNPYVEWGNGWNDTSTIEQRSCWTRSCVIKATK